MDHSEIRVLVIDDEPFIRESLAGFLEDCDFEVTSAESGEEALELLKTSPVEIAIVDLRLPGMNGDALIQQVNKVSRNIRFLIHTGSVDYRISKELDKIGVRPEHVFYKPQPDLSLFVEKIEALLQDS
ncbi:MAG: response regulator [Proteobacteria bacterium]|nr:response regulator [Pseudomonadota bacterium]